MLLLEKLLEPAQSANCPSLNNLEFSDFGSLKLAKVGILIPWKVANATNRGSEPV